MDSKEETIKKVVEEKCKEDAGLLGALEAVQTA